MSSAHETVVNFREFRKNLSSYLRDASQGAEFVITSRGEEMARIIPPTPKSQRRGHLIGMFKGRFQMAVDFDETPEILLSAMEGEED
jgi:prevent-host-death family protein